MAVDRHARPRQYAGVGKTDYRNRHQHLAWSAQQKPAYMSAERVPVIQRACPELRTQHARLAGFMK